MALVLSLKRDEDFYIGNERFVVVRVQAEERFRLRRDSTGEIFQVAGTQATKVMDDVFVSAGKERSLGLARVVIDAPPDLLVLRGDNYRNPAKRGGEPR